VEGSGTAPRRALGRGAARLEERAPLIFLIRHGETHGNAARIVQLPDIPLSSRGIAQAERLAQRLRSAGIGHILSSDLARAAATALPVQRATGVEITFDPVLQERNFGDIRGTPYADLGFDPFALEYAPPGGESWEVFHARVDRAWELVRRFADTTAGHLAVVTHGLVCRSLAARHLSLPDGLTAPERWDNTSVTIAESHEPWRVHLLNSIAHLDGIDVSPLPTSGPA
jgi:probable phosphoglycerate mutase